MEHTVEKIKKIFKELDRINCTIETLNEKLEKADKNLKGDKQ